MTKQSDIFKGLKEHGIAPPTGVREKLFHILNTGMNPFIPSSLRSPLDKTIPALPRMGFLQQEAIAPPKDAFDTIMTRIKLEQKTAHRLYGRLRLYRYGAVAASLVLALTGWIAYRTTHLSLHAGTAPTFANAKPPAANRQGLVADTAHSLGNNTMGKDLPGRDSGTVRELNTSGDKDKTAGADDYFRNTRVRVDGQAFPLVDNDLLITLTNFQYNEMPGFLTHDNVDTKVQVDQYAAIEISPGMKKMMKKMYTYRAQGVPTRRARKERERLQGWKKDDESRFDGSNGKNPLNPVDLATFIFK